VQGRLAANLIGIGRIHLHPKWHALAIQHENAYKASINRKAANISIFLYDPEEA
jgi:hypothetical protein